MNLRAELAWTLDELKLKIEIVETESVVGCKFEVYVGQYDKQNFSESWALRMKWEVPVSVGWVRKDSGERKPERTRPWELFGVAASSGFADNFHVRLSPPPDKYPKIMQAEFQAYTTK